MALRFGLIGCGRIAPRHAQSITANPNSRLIAVADIIESRGKKFANDFSVDFYTNYHLLLERDDIDVINICTPSGLHAEMAIDAMHSGKHVIVEKPMALSLTDADKMIMVSEKEGVLLSVVLQNRFNSPIQDLRKVVDSGKLGRLLLGNATVRWYRPQEYYEDEWHGTWAMDGGALLNQSIHHIDALQWLMGNVESVFTYTATLAHKMEAEDIGVAVLRFESGALGIVEGSTVTYPQNLEGSISLFGEYGSVKVGGTALNRKEFWKIQGGLEHERELLIHEQIDPPSIYGKSHESVILEMIHAVMEGKEPSTNGREGRKSLALVLAMYESSRSGKPVSMKEGIWYGSDGK